MNLSKEVAEFVLRSVSSQLIWDFPCYVHACTFIGDEDLRRRASELHSKQYDLARECEQLVEDIAKRLKQAQQIEEV
jgi:hypothetical protein